MAGYIYILASKKEGRLYIGVTTDLIQRVAQHKEGNIEGLTKKYHIKKLMHYERYDDIRDAIQREKQLKEWNREWKIELFKTQNPHWHDLYETLF